MVLRPAHVNSAGIFDRRNLEPCSVMPRVTHGADVSGSILNNRENDETRETPFCLLSRLSNISRFDCCTDCRTVRCVDGKRVPGGCQSAGSIRAITIRCNEDPVDSN